MTYPIKKLGEVIELQYGKGIAQDQRDEHGKVPIYGANGILGWTDKVWASGEAIIVGRKGSAGELIRVSGKFWPSDVTYYVFGNEHINIDYLFHVLKSVNLPSLAAGIKPGINRNRVYEIEIPLPPVEEQRKIVTKIEKAFGKIDEATRLCVESEALAAQILPDALHKIFSVSDWGTKPLKEISEIKTGGTPSKANDMYWNGDIPWVSPKDMKSFVIDDAIDHISGVAVKKSATNLVPKGSVLVVVRSGILKHTLPVSVVSREVAFNQDIKSITVDSKKIIPEFLAYCLKGNESGILMQGIKKGVTVQSFEGKYLENFKVPLPPLAEQKKIIKKLGVLAEKARALRDLQSSQSADLKALKQSILHEAFAAGL